MSTEAEKSNPRSIYLQPTPIAPSCTPSYEVCSAPSTSGKLHLICEQTGPQVSGTCLRPSHPIKSTKQASDGYGTCKQVGLELLDLIKWAEYSCPAGCISHIECIILQRQIGRLPRSPRISATRIVHVATRASPRHELPIRFPPWNSLCRGSDLALDSSLRYLRLLSQSTTITASSLHTITSHHTAGIETESDSNVASAKDAVFVRLTSSG